MSSQNRELAVIVGAGRTGRGFLARLMNLSGYKIAFVDRDNRLVDTLNEAGAYTIHFFRGRQPAFRIDGVVAYLSGSHEASEILNQATVILTAVGEANLTAVAQAILSGLKAHPDTGRKLVRILVCENGISPARRIQDVFGDTESVEIAGAAIFCSTVGKDGSRLDILSEVCDELPYDRLGWSEHPRISGLVAVSDFNDLLKRKIYTYNCLCACITYLGALKGFTWLADAANDPEIAEVTRRVAVDLDIAIADLFGIPLRDQNEFSKKAVSKFRDSCIRDDIKRNARNVLAKLAPTERLAAPARFILDHQGDFSGLALTIAAALHYEELDNHREEKQRSSMSIENILVEVCGFEKEHILTRSVAAYYRELESNPEKTLGAILDDISSQYGLARKN